MTLVVAAIADKAIWMVSGSAITGPQIDLRAREFMPKIEVGRTFPALIGFAGAAEPGLSCARAASTAADRTKAVSMLEHASAGGTIDFVYGCFDAGAAMLFYIARGKAEARPAVNLGSGFNQGDCI